MTKKTYSEKLKDPRWQKKRLKVFERDNWACVSCYDSKSTLHVHHKKYTKCGNPWESPMKDLETLCETCHILQTKISDWIKAAKKDATYDLNLISDKRIFLWNYFCHVFPWIEDSKNRTPGDWGQYSSHILTGICRHLEIKIVNLKNG